MASNRNKRLKLITWKEEAYGKTHILRWQESVRKYGCPPRVFRCTKGGSLKLAEQLYGGRLRGIRVPTLEREERRLVTRTREQLVRARRRVQELSSEVLRSVGCRKGPSYAVFYNSLRRTGEVALSKALLG